jgi:hypothetical protein
VSRLERDVVKSGEDRKPKSGGVGGALIKKIGGRIA